MTREAKEGGGNEMRVTTLGAILEESGRGENGRRDSRVRAGEHPAPNGQALEGH